MKNEESFFPMQIERKYRTIATQNIQTKSKFGKCRIQYASHEVDFLCMLNPTKAISTGIWNDEKCPLCSEISMASWNTINIVYVLVFILLGK